MRRSARTDLCGGRPAMIVPTATAKLFLSELEALGLILLTRPASGSNVRVRLSDPGEDVHAQPMAVAKRIKTSP